MEEKRNKIWLSRIKANIRQKYKNEEISKKYKLQEFCDDFIPDNEETESMISEECICGHSIKKNYLYKHKYNNDVFILGSCCIKTFSTERQKERKCLDCDIKIRKNQYNRCRECVENHKDRQKYICECGKYKKPYYTKCYLCNKKKYAN